MAKNKEFDFTVPDRADGEEDASKKQKDFIRNLCDGIDPAELEKLGKWQASELIDQLKEFREEHGIGSKSKRGGKKKKEGGCAYTLIAYAIIGGLLLLFFRSCS